MNLEQNDYDEYFKSINQSIYSAIIVGDSGTGKTNAIITYNTGIYVVMCRRKTRSYDSYSRNRFLLKSGQY